jgi:hypothetical protein
VQVLRHVVHHQVVPAHLDGGVGLARRDGLLLQSPQPLLSTLLLLHAPVVLHTVRLNANRGDAVYPSSLHAKPQTVRAHEHKPLSRHGRKATNEQCTTSTC